MKPRAYYNDFDPFCCAWLRELMAAGLIMEGEIDNRSIRDVQPDDLRGFTRWHFFAGIAGWERALQLAGWPTGLPVFTGSCPCQPFSCAGKGKGQADERHLWPEMFRLIAACRPERVFGEQVESAIRHGWLDGVFADLESEDYACGAAVLGAHSVGAPHIRQRLYWGARLADAECGGCESGRNNRAEAVEPRPISDVCGHAIRLEHPAGDGREPRRAESGGRGAVGGCEDGGVGDAGGEGLAQRSGQPGHDGSQCTAAERTGGDAGFWSNSILIPCADGKARRIGQRLTAVAPGLSAGMERGGEARMVPIEVLATKEEGRVGLLKGYGNAINPYCGSEFIKAFMEDGQ